MDYEAGDYRRLAVKQFPARALRETAEGRYWRQFGAPVFAKQFGPVSCLDFCAARPHHLAVTASTRVVVYDGRTRQVRRTFARFKDIAFSGAFRADGRLLVAGGQSGVVQLFDANSRGVLRQLKGHQGPAHVARFAPDDRTHVLSGGDDVTLRWWDITAGKQVSRLTGHDDYVRAAAASPAGGGGDTWASGSYDHTVKLWDVRAGGSSGSSSRGGSSSGSSACVMTLDHGAPVEALAFLPGGGGGLLVSAGGTQLCVWDLVGGGRLLRRLCNFQKTVSCVAASPLAGPGSAAAPRLLAGALDGHVKVFELDGFRVTHASRYPAPVTAVGLSGDCALLAVGMADGALSVRQHKHHATGGAAAGGAGAVAVGAGGGGGSRGLALSLAAAGAGGGGARRRPGLTAGNFRFFLRGRGARPGGGDVVVAARRRAHLAPYDRALRAFRYRDALDAALATRRPDVVHSMLDELAARGALHAALAGREPAALLPLLRHLAKHVADPRHSASLAGVAARVLDIYAPVVHTCARVDAALARLRDALQEEVRLQEALARLGGALEPILAAALGGGR